MAASAYTFPYKYKYIKEGKILDPFVSIPIKTKFGWQSLWFLLDKCNILFNSSNKQIEFSIVLNKNSR